MSDPKKSHAPSRVEVLATRVEAALGPFRFERTELRHERFDGSMSEAIVRVNFERGDGVAVLLWNPDTERVVLVRQFRYSAWAALARDAGGEPPDGRAAWMLEIVAGMQDGGRAAAEVARAELLEEAGYHVRGELHYLLTIYPSPGGTSERIFVFRADVEASDRVAQGGGLAHEHEDVEVVELPLHEALAKVRSGEITDAKTVVALQHLALERAG